MKDLFLFLKLDRLPLLQHNFKMRKKPRFEVDQLAEFKFEWKKVGSGRLINETWSQKNNTFIYMLAGEEKSSYPNGQKYFLYLHLYYWNEKIWIVDWKNVDFSSFLKVVQLKSQKLKAKLGLMEGSALIKQNWSKMLQCLNKAKLKWNIISTWAALWINFIGQIACSIITKKNITRPLGQKESYFLFWLMKKRIST